MKYKFKIGDKVRCEDGEGVIVYIDQVYIHTSIPYLVFVDGNSLWKAEEELTLLESSSFKLIPGKHIVKTRNGNLYLLVECTDEKLVGINIKDDLYVDFNLDDDLKDLDDHDFDIMEVFEFAAACWSRIKYDLERVWKREETEEMTIAEIEKELGYKVKVVKG